MINKEHSYEAYIKAGWTDAQLIENGLATKSDAGVPSAPPQSPHDNEEVPF